MPASCRSGIAASGHVDHGHRCDVFSHERTFSPSWRSVDDEVVEVVLELRHDHAGLDRAHADAAPVRVGAEIEVGGAGRGDIGVRLCDDGFLAARDRLRPAPLRDAHDVARPHRPEAPRRRAAHRRRRARVPVAELGDRPQARPGRRAAPRSHERARRPPRAHPRRPRARVELRRRPAARLLGRVRARRPPRRDGRRRGRDVPELRAALGAHARRGPRRAHRQHDRVEPLVRVGRGRRPGPRAPGRAPARCATRRGSRASSPGSSARACASR